MIAGRRTALAVLAVLLGAGCESKRAAPAGAAGSGSGAGAVGAGAGSGAGSGAVTGHGAHDGHDHGGAAGSGDAAGAAAVVSMKTAKLPGTLWFVQERPARRLIRLSAERRSELSSAEGDLFPTAFALPDGRLVAISSRGDGSPDSEQLALVGGDDGVTPLGPAANTVRSPAVDAKGRWIVIAVNASGQSDLYRIDPATGAQVRLTNDPKGNFTPARLGGDAIAFASSRDGNSEIYRMPVAGGKPQRLTAFHKDDWAPVPAPDGKTLAFSSDREGPARIFIVAADGTSLRRLTDRKDKDRDEASPVWSPDGRLLAYLVQGGGESSLWLRDVAAGTERVLTPLRERDHEPSFSPDGAWLAVSRGRDDHDGDLWALPVSAAGGGPLRLTAAPGLERLPRWLP